MIRTFAGCAILLVGCCVMAQGPNIPAPTITKGPVELPPPSDPKNLLEKLKATRTDLKTEREAAAKAIEAEDAGNETERKELRKKLDELLKRLENRPKAAIPDPRTLPKIGPGPDPRLTPPGAEPVSAATDALLLAQNLYRSGDFASALKAFRLIDLTQYAREDKAFIQYMTACCLRRTGKSSEAAVMYREIADARDDEFVTECCLWQLGSLRWREDMEKQLAQLKQRREAMVPK